MKILFACSYNSVFRKNTTPFVKSLIEGMRSKGCSVDCGLHKFWTGFDDYDIIYLQWPEEIYQWNRSKINIDLYLFYIIKVILDFESFLA